MAEQDDNDIKLRLEPRDRRWRRCTTTTYYTHHSTPTKATNNTMCTSSKSTKQAPTKGKKVSAARGKSSPFLSPWEKPKGPTFVYQTRSYIPCKQAEVDEFNAKQAYKRSIGARICQRALPTRRGIKFYCSVEVFIPLTYGAHMRLKAIIFVQLPFSFFLMKRFLKKNLNVNHNNHIVINTINQTTTNFLQMFFPFLLLKGKTQ